LQKSGNDSEKRNQLFQKAILRFRVLLYTDCYRACHSCFVTLSFAKGCCKSRSSFSVIHLVFVFHLFLPEKDGAKKFKASPNRSARLAAHAQATVITTIILFLLRSKQHDTVFFATFSKPHVLPSRCNKR
jgi:hypothetical protein